MIPVGVLTYQRPHFLKQTLESFIIMNHVCLDKFKIIVLVQSEDDETKEVIGSFGGYLHDVLYEKNVGCAKGYSRVMEICLSYNEPLIMHLQDDWLSTEPLTYYMGFIEKLFEERPEVGYLRLRSPKEPTCKMNRISREIIDKNQIFSKRETLLGRQGNYPEEPYVINWWDIKNTIYKGRYHFTFNPTVIRSEVLMELLPFANELDAMRRYHKTGLYGAQLNANCFRHIGLKRAVTVDKKGRERWIK